MNFSCQKVYNLFAKNQYYDIVVLWKDAMYKVFGKINCKCTDGKRADSIENALINFKQLTNSTENIIISVAELNNYLWYILSDQDLELAKQLTEKIFDEDVKFVKYAPSSMRLLKR